MSRIRPYPGLKRTDTPNAGLVGKFPIRRSSPNNIKDQAMDGPFITPSIALNRNSKGIIPRSSPPFYGIQRALPFKGFTTVGPKSCFPFVAV
jgi:hypothetical protein